MTLDCIVKKVRSRVISNLCRFFEKSFLGVDFCPKSWYNNGVNRITRCGAMVARLLWEQDAAGSSPVTSTSVSVRKDTHFLLVMSAWYSFVHVSEEQIRLLFFYASNCVTIDDTIWTGMVCHSAVNSSFLLLKCSEFDGKWARMHFFFFFRKNIGKIYCHNRQKMVSL